MLTGTSRPPPRPALTHFLCLPLVTQSSRPQLTESLAAFRADVTSPASFSVPQEAVRPVGTLHLTLGMMSFPRDEGLDRAVAFLQTLKPSEILASIQPRAMPGSRPGGVEEAPQGAGPESPAGRLDIALRGLQSMQPAARASVLYAPPADQEGILQQFCETIRSAFQEAELLVPEDRPLLLHATIVNTVYVKGRRQAGGKGKPRGGKPTIDARGILDRYEDCTWMDKVRLEKIAICKMGAKKTEVDGVVVDEAYETVVEIDV